MYEINSTRRVFVDLGGGRSALSVALRKDGALLGAINVYRQEVRPFTDKQIALLQNFAAQAVIAMENARLITETREALEQQTATAEVLGVINSSPGDLAPVFDAILEKAHSLCGAALGSLFTYDGEFFHGAASHGLPEAIGEIAASVPPWPTQPSVAARGRGAACACPPYAGSRRQRRSRRTRATFGYAPPVEQDGIRTMLVVPLRKDGALLGVISAYRREVKPFTDKQIALLREFRGAGGDRDGERAAARRIARAHRRAGRARSRS